MEQLHEAGSGMEERLWSFIDGSASQEERSVIAKLVESRAEWKAKYQELLDVHALLQSSELDAPSLRFTKNVMDEIARQHIAPATRRYINNNIIRGLAIFFVSMIVGFLAYGFGQYLLVHLKAYLSYETALLTAQQVACATYIQVTHSYLETAA